MSDVRHCEQGKTCPHCGGIHFGQSFCPMNVSTIPTATAELSDADKLKEWAEMVLRDPLNIEVPKLKTDAARKLVHTTRKKMNELAAALESF